jgi:glycosyltransferase involved in cell wall biosynthesis
VPINLAVVNLTAGGFSGGYRKHLAALLPLLASSPRIGRLHVYSPIQARGLVPGEFGIQSFWTSGDALRGYRSLRGWLRRAEPDVVFIPTARWLDLGATPSVIMVRNMEPLETPFAGSGWLESLRNAGRRYAAQRACRRATRIIAVSNHVRDYLTTEWGVANDRIGVVYPGVDIPSSGDLAARPAGLAAHVDAGRFLFTAGSIRPARGLEDAVHALAILAEQGTRIPLVIAGSVSGSSSYATRIRSLAQSLGVAAQIVWAGQLSAAEMSWCHRHCAAFVMTSRVEACPNTALEALAHGTITVSSTRPPMPEFFGDAALYYTAGDAPSLAESLGVALKLDGPERERFAQRGIALARAFTWQRSATMTLDQLEASCAERPVLRRAV